MTRTPTAFVTGCATGFGRRLTDRLLAAGWVVHATDPSPPEDWEGGAPSGTGTLVTHLLDVRDPDQVTQATQGLGPVDLLVNNAGYAVFGTQEETDLDAVKELFDVNVLGLARVTQAVLPRVREAQGTVVQLSSVAGRTVFPESGFYAATKYAVEAMSEALFQECATFGVRVRLIEPGSFDTRFLDTALERSPAPPENSAYDGVRELWMRRKVAVLETPQDPERVVDAIMGCLDAPEPFLRIPVGPDSERILLVRDLLGADGWSTFAAERNGLPPQLAPEQEVAMPSEHARERLRALDRWGHLDHWEDTDVGRAALAVLRAGDTD